MRSALLAACVFSALATASWPATLTVVPGPADEKAQSVGWAVIAGIVGAGLLVAGCIVVLAWRRSPNSR